MNRKNRR